MRNFGWAAGVQLGAKAVSSVSVEVTHPTLGSVDLCAPSGSSFTGQSRVIALGLSYSHDPGVWSASLTLSNHQAFRAANESLDPGHTSNYNPGGVPLIGAYNRITISIGKGGESAVLVFDGYLGPGNMRGGEDVEGNDTLEVDLVGVMHPYSEYYIDKIDGLVYSETYISTAVERDMLNQILRDYGFAEVVEIEDDPSYYVHNYEIGDVSLLEALERPIYSIGYLLTERHHTGSGTFRPTVVDPLRTDYVADVSLGGDLKVFRTGYSEAGVRTAVRIVYRHRETGKQAHRDASSDSAKALYGVPDGSGGRKHRYMRIVEKDGSLIDTPAEAQDMADYALHDLSTPCPEAEIQIPWLALGFEGGELVEVETASETVKVGVTEISYALPQGDTVGSTTLRGTLEKRIGSRRYWFERGRTDWIGKHDRDRDERMGPSPDAPTKLDAQGVWGEGEAGDAVPVLHTRWSGTRNWNLAGYCVRYREVELTLSSKATGGSTTTVEDTSQSWTPKAYHDRYYVWLKGADRNAIARKVLGNTATVLTIEEVDSAVAVDEDYELLKVVGDWTYVSTDLYPYQQIPSLSEGKRVIVEVAAEPVSARR